MPISEPKKKILFCLRAGEHFSYYQTIIDSLAREGHVLELLYSPRRTNMARLDQVIAYCAMNPNVSWGWMAQRLPLTRRLSRYTRELRTYGSYLLRQDQDPFFRLRWQKRLPRLLSILGNYSWFNNFVASKTVGRSLEMFENFLPAASRVVQDLKRRRPDVVFACPVNMHNCFSELEYVKAARAGGIPTVSLVFSWDNLSTKGLFHVQPDMLLAWNQLHKEEAVRIHQFRADQVLVIGSPFFDKWFSDTREGLSREDFCQRVGLNPQRPFVLYLGSSINIGGGDETWLVRKLEQELEQSSHLKVRDLQVLVRPHGANQDVFHKLEGGRLRLWFRDRLLPDTPESFQEFKAAIRHAVCAVGLNTSAMVDAVIAGCPVVTLLVKEYANTNAANAVHFKDILKKDVFERAGSVPEAVDKIDEIYQGRDLKQQQREVFVSRDIRPRGLRTSAGQIGAKAVELIAMGKSPQEIEQQLTSQYGPIHPANKEPQEQYSMKE